MPVKPETLRLKRPPPERNIRAWELIAPRLPRVVIRWGGRVWRRLLPHGSRARRRTVVAGVAIAYEASARNRADLILPLMHPEIEWRWDENFQSLGLDAVYRGHDGFTRSLADWNRTWSDATFTVVEVLDGGDTLLTRLAIHTRGASSGVPVEMPMSHVHRVDRESGLVVRHSVFRDDAEALHDAGFA